MNRIPTLFAAFALLLCAAATASAAPGDGVEWHKDYKTARELARKTGKPMLIEFGADWCPPCNEMKRSFWPNAQTVALSKKFVCVNLNFDARGPELSLYGVDRIPAVVFADSWGNALTTRIGFKFQDVWSFHKLMQAMPDDFSAIDEWNGILERDKNNPAALVNVAGFYRDRTAPDLSNLYYKRALKAKGLEADPKAREDALLSVGINYLRQREYDEAKKSFEAYLTALPDGARADTARLGILTALLNKKKFDEAQKVFEQLKAGHPDSPAVGQAAELFRQAQSLKK